MNTLQKLRDSGRNVELLAGDNVRIDPPPPEEWIPRLVEVKPEIIQSLKAESMELSIQVAMKAATNGINITPDEFRAAIDTDEAELCATGEIPIDAARAYARLFADKSWQ